jgi:hypothetical protein
VILDHIDPMCSLSLSSVHIALHAVILYLSLIYSDLVLYLVSYAESCSHEYHTCLSIFMMLSLTCVVAKM